jgi:hypothetical protein
MPCGLHVQPWPRDPNSQFEIGHANNRPNTMTPRPFTHSRVHPVSWPNAPLDPFHVRSFPVRSRAAKMWPDALGHDRTCPCIRSSLPRKTAGVGIRHHLTRCTSIVLGHFLPQCPISDQDHALHSTTNRTRRSSVLCSARSLPVTFLTSPTLPPLLKCANHQVFHLVHVC